MLTLNHVIMDTSPTGHFSYWTARLYKGVVKKLGFRFLQKKLKDLKSKF